MNIIGRLTKDAQVRNLDNNRQVVNFSVATNESYRRKTGERIKQTTYFDCDYWLSPNVAKILTKGTLVELTGRMETRAWTDKEGKPRAAVNFHTSTITLHGGGKRTSDSQPDSIDTDNKMLTETQVDDLPF